jgi:hypothetical protein
MHRTNMRYVVKYRYFSVKVKVVNDGITGRGCDPFLRMNWNCGVFCAVLSSRALLPQTQTESVSGGKNEEG